MAEISATETLGRKRNKLRSSCDACGNAKVKCDRQDVCGRCVDHGLDCHYGVSKRMGRRKRKSVQWTSIQPQGDSGSEVVSTSSSRNVAVPHVEGSISRQPSITGSASISTQEIDIDGSIESVSTDYRGSIPTSPYPFLDVNEFSQDWYDFDNFIEQHIANSDISQFMNPEPVPIAEHRMNVAEEVEADGLRGQPSFDPSLVGQQSPGVAINTPSQPQDGNLIGQLESGQSGAPSKCLGLASEASWLQEATNILNSLTFMGNTCSMGNAVSSALLDSESSLDQILHVNRMSVGRLEHLMTSSGSKSPEPALISSLAIMRVLRWYRHAARRGSNYARKPTPAIAKSPSLHRSGSSSIAQPDGSGTTLDAHTTRPGVAATTAITFGSLRIEDSEVVTALQMQVLAGELKNLGRLIDVLIASHQPAGQHPLASPPCDGGDLLYHGLDSLLRSEYARVLDITKARLRELSA